MPRKKVPCPVCGSPKSAQSKTCRKCSVPYVRTEEHRQELSRRFDGVPKLHLRGRKRPEHSLLMKEWWTPERRQAKRDEMLHRNPNARYHGLSAKAAARLVKSVGRCDLCGGDGSASRLGVHHKDRNKHNQDRENLQVLCHRCHMQEHATQGETGAQVYHRKRMMNLS